jgi:hypothetical protein
VAAQLVYVVIPQAKANGLWAAVGEMAYIHCREFASQKVLDSLFKYVNAYGQKMEDGRRLRDVCSCMQLSFTFSDS